MNKETSIEFPPKNFEVMRQFLIMLRQGEIDLDVGKKSLNALSIMINDPDSVAINNIVGLAKLTYISPASITRLAKLLGFKGFNQFQLIFKQRTKIPSDYYSQKAKLLIQNKVDSPRDILDKQLFSTTENMRFCIEKLPNESLAKAVKLLSTSGRVFIFGHKQSSAMANLMRYGLCLIRYNVQILGQYEHGIASALGQLKINDLVVVISSAPYSNLSIEIAASVKAQQCKLLVITDSYLSPLIEMSDASIVVPTGGQFYTNSLAATCVLIEGLLSLTAKQYGSLAVTKLQKHESLMTDLNENS